jgi:hypothetical protein
MRLAALAPAAVLSATLLGLAGCDVPAGGIAAGPVARTEVAMTPFTYKANTPRAVRAYDLNECELAGRGLPPNADPATVAAATAAIPAAEVEGRVRACLTSKGYLVTELPVCTDADYLTGQIVQSPEVFPPLQAIQCLNPVARHMLVRSGTVATPVS